MKDLKPCPFCKEHDRLYVQKSIGDACWGKCLECGAEGPIAKTKQEAIDAWNTRAEHSEELACDGCRDEFYGDNCGMCIRNHRLTDCFKVVS